MTEGRSAVKIRMPCHIGGNNRYIDKAKSIKFKCVLYVSSVCINHFPTELMIEGGPDFLWCCAVLRITLSVF